MAILRVLSMASSHAPSIIPSPGPASYLPSSHNPSPVGLDEGGRGLDGDDDIADLSDEAGSRGNTSDREEDDMDDTMDAIGSEPKVKEDIRPWKELREQLKSDWVEGHKKHETPTCLNKLTILQNFATLCIKGVRRIAASEEIAWQWHEGMGRHFACQI
jgi:hypothetical protein